MVATDPSTAIILIGFICKENLCLEFGIFVITHIHLAKQFERRRFDKIDQLETRTA
jgi:hypothetical protein